MRRTNGLAGWLAAGAVAAMALAWSAGARQGGKPSIRPATVATIDVQKVVNSLDEIAQREQELNAFREALRAKVKVKDDALKAAQSALELLQQKSPEYRQKWEEARRLTVELKMEGDISVQLIDEKRGAIWAEIFRKVIDASGRLAAQNGYDVILNNDSTESVPENVTESGIRALIAARRTLFAAPALDATDELIQMMNNEHKLGAGKR
ncbi:MAG: OmpH family outer membrane protein [Phycisphaerales bacterium]